MGKIGLMYSFNEPTFKAVTVNTQHMLAAIIIYLVSFFQRIYHYSIICLLSLSPPYPTSHTSLQDVSL